MAPKKKSPKKSASFTNAQTGTLIGAGIGALLSLFCGAVCAENVMGCTPVLSWLCMPADWLGWVLGGSVPAIRLAGVSYLIVLCAVNGGVLAGGKKLPVRIAVVTASVVIHFTLVFLDLRQWGEPVPDLLPG